MKRAHITKNRQAQINRLETRIHGRTQKLFSKVMKSDNPVVRASNIWDTIKDQLKIILGDTVYKQWFAETRALVIADNVLILKTQNDFAAKWLTTYYQALIETLLSVHDKNLSCFFIGPSDTYKNKFN